MKNCFNLRLSNPGQSTIKGRGSIKEQYVKPEPKSNNFGCLNTALPYQKVGIITRSSVAALGDG